MPVEVKFFAGFREKIGKKKIQVSANTVNKLLKKIIQEYPKMEKTLYSNGDDRILRKSVNIIVNGQIIESLDGLNTRLKDGDVVAIFPPVSGG